MSTTPWTPGPWIATRSDPAEGCDVWWITACHSANQEKEIATVAGGYPSKRNETNAALIAAAPDLAEALRRIEEGCSFPQDDVQRACRDVARAALAKARGEK